MKCTWLTVTGFIYQNPERQEKWTAVNRQESSCSELPSVSLTFQHLRPLTMYIAEVKCRPFGSQYWSEPARCSFVTTISSMYDHNDILIYRWVFSSSRISQIAKLLVHVHLKIKEFQSYPISSIDMRRIISFERVGGFVR